MYYIYCYINKINNHKYVGQTNNLQRRIREHKSCAFNEKASSYNDLIHRKIREYSIDNFEIIVLEKIYTDNITEVNNREQYWIKEMESHVSTGKGYNVTWGGDSREHARQWSDEEINHIKTLIKQGIPFIEIQNQYHCSTSFLSSLNHGVYYFNEEEQYPLFKYYKEDADYDELIELLLHSTYSLSKIANMLGIGYSTVKKINTGTLRPGLYPTYPIRNKTVYAIKADKIKELLMNTRYCHVKIAQMTDSSVQTVERINFGESHYDTNLTYPLRTL